MSKWSVRRPAALCAAVAAVAAMAIAAAPSSSGPTGAASIGPASAAAADCIPVNHSKTVVKRVKVKRKGKLVKVKRKRKKRWTTCEPAPPAPLPCTDPASVLGVTANDLTEPATYTLSRSCVTAGDVFVQLNNSEAMDPHNLFLRRTDSGSTAPAYRLPEASPFELGPGEVDSATFNLTAGDWYLWCDLLLHEEQGMNAQLAVR